MHDTKEDADKRCAFKMKLMREVLKINRDYDTVLYIYFYFLDYLLRLPEELSKKLYDTMAPIEQKKVIGMGQIERKFVSPTMEAILSGVQEIGEKRGAEKNTTKIVLEKLKEDTPIDFIAKETGLDIEVIKKQQETN